MAEWLKALALKASKLLKVSEVRILLLPIGINTTKYHRLMHDMGQSNSRAEIPVMIHGTLVGDCVGSVGGNFFKRVVL